MAFINDHQVIVAPVQPRQVDAVGLPEAAGQIGVVEDIVAQAILGQRIVAVVLLVGVPVFRQLFGAEHQDRFVAALVILDHGQRREGFAEANAVGQNAAVVFFQLVDDGEGRVFLEVVQHIPDFAVLEAGGLIGQDILGNIVQKFAENVVQCEKVDEFRGIFPVGGGDAFEDLIGHILQAGIIAPQFVKQAKILPAVFGCLGAGDEVIDIVAALAAEVYGGEAVDGHVGTFIHRDKAGHLFLRCVGLEGDLAADPVGAFAGDGFQGQLVAQFDLKFGAVDAALTVEARNVEFPLCFGHFLLEKCGRSEQETKLFHAFQLLLQFLVGVNRKAGCSDGNAAALTDRLAQIVPNRVGQIVKKQHGCPPSRLVRIFSFYYTTKTDIGQLLECCGGSLHVGEWLSQVRLTQ